MAQEIKAPKSHYNRILVAWLKMLAKFRKEPISGPTRHRHHAPKHHALSFHQRVVAMAHHSLSFAGKMHYTENLTLRQVLFHRASGQFLGASADCSQYVASILHWLGVKIVSSTDATGALLAKGRKVAGPAPGVAAIFGTTTTAAGVHTGFITERTPDGKDWYVVGFGHNGAPDRVTLSGMIAYFKGRGELGVSYRDFEGK